MTKPLIERDKDYVAGSFPDDFVLTAMEIEDSLIEAGAVPGKDYSFVDLYSLATPFMLQIYRECRVFSGDKPQYDG